MGTKFLLLLGASGVGKTVIIRILRRVDKRFTFISPYITRLLRPGEEDKISVSDAVLDDMDSRGAFLVVNSFYGVRYGTPLQPILTAFHEGNFPILDWPVSRISLMKEVFGERLFIVYLFPPSLEELEKRLAKDNRDSDAGRLNNAGVELNHFHSGKFSELYDLAFETQDDREEEIALLIYHAYLASMDE